MPQLVVVVDILVAQRNGVHTLRHQRLHVVHHQIGIALVAEATRNPPRQADGAIGLRSSAPPPFDVTAPPSKQPTTWRPANPSNSSCVALQSVGIGRAFPEKACVAVARKLAIIMHRMWVEGTDFRFGQSPAAVAA